MKILYHHRTAAADGQYVHIRELTDAMESLGHEVVFVGPGRSRYRQLETGANGRNASPSRALRAIRELLELIYTIPAFLRLWRGYLRTKPDVLYERSNLFFLSGLWLKRLTGIPYLLEVNAPLAEERRIHGTLFCQKLAARTEQAVWRGADHCLPVTNVLADYLRDAGVSDSRLTVIHNGVGDAYLQDVQHAGPVPGLDGCTVLGFTGFIRDWHGLDRVIDFVVEQGDMLNLHFVIVGDGPARSALEAQVAENKIAHRVTFTGVVQREEVAAHVGQFDIALQPDVVAYASPLKLFEYMAMGKAIVAPDTANIGEVLTHNANARLFPAGDVEAFCNQVEQLAMDPALRQRLGQAARLTIIDGNYTWSANASCIVDIAQRLADSQDS